MTIFALLISAFVASAVLLGGLVRLLPGDFLAAAVTARSNHAAPARQIGGLAAAPVAILAVAIAGWAGLLDSGFAIGAIAGAALLAIVGFVDDRRDLGAGAKLAGQFAGAMLLLCFVDAELRLLPALPLIAERALLTIALVWWVNMTNFMDGLDLMMVAGIAVPHAAIALAGALGLVDAAPAILSAAIAGALFGFAVFNVPPAKIFLGDSGSLALGLLSGAVVLLLARTSILAAVLPFGFFLADSISTIVMRARNGENILAAHSVHAYQVGRRAGRPVPSIVAEVAVVSLVCSGLAVAASAWGHPYDIVAFVLGAAVAAASAVRMRRQARAARG